MALSKAQAEVLRRMRDGDVLMKHNGSDWYGSKWAGESKSLNQGTINVLSIHRFIERNPCVTAWAGTWDWCLTDAGRQALKEYEARQPCDVANGDNDAAG